MKISTRAQYGTRALLDIASHYTGVPIRERDIAMRQNIPLPYLERLINMLVGTGIVISTRGSKGGVKLAKSPQDIKLIEVVSILEGSMTVVECLDNPDVCPRSKFCSTKDLWGDVNRAMLEVLESNTLQDLVDRQREKDDTQQFTYHI